MGPPRLGGGSQTKSSPLHPRLGWESRRVNQELAVFTELPRALALLTCSPPSMWFCSFDKNYGGDNRSANQYLEYNPI